MKKDSEKTRAEQRAKQEAEITRKKEMIEKFGSDAELRARLEEEESAAREKLNLDEERWKEKMEVFGIRI